jgi:hypothetical protein
MYLKMVGKIRHYYDLAKEDEPFGLRAASFEALEVNS